MWDKAFSVLSPRPPPVTETGRNRPSAVLSGGVWRPNGLTFRVRRKRAPLRALVMAVPVLGLAGRGPGAPGGARPGCRRSVVPGTAPYGRHVARQRSVGIRVPRRLPAAAARGRWKAAGREWRWMNILGTLRRPVGPAPAGDFVR